MNGSPAKSPLSKFGTLVVYAVSFPLLLWNCWETFMNVGFGRMLNEGQARILFGRYYPALTLLSLVFVSGMIGLSAGYFVDWAFRLGKFRPRR